MSSWIEAGARPGTCAACNAGPEAHGYRGKPFCHSTLTKIEMAKVTASKTGAVKNDSGKSSRPELLDFQFLDGLGEVLALGAVEYGAENWRKGMAWSRLIGGLMRHVISFGRGEKVDPKTGKHPLLHAACCLMFLYVYDVRDIGLDDRHKL